MINLNWPANSRHPKAVVQCGYFMADKIINDKMNDYVRKILDISQCPNTQEKYCYHHFQDLLAQYAAMRKGEKSPQQF